MRSHNEKRLPVGHWVRPLAVGMAVGLVVCVLFLAVFALVMALGMVPSRVATPFALAAATLGSLFGGFAAARLARVRGLLYGAGCGALLFLLLTAVGFAFFPDASPTLLPLKAVLTVVAGALGGVWGVNAKRR